MERCFIATKDSELFKDFDTYQEKAEVQRKFIKKFFIEKGIEGTCYHMSGTGIVGQPFDKDEKSNIGLSIEATEVNINKFNKMLCKPNQYKLCAFKKNSSMAKEFAQKCVDNKIIINLYEPDLRDYFKSLGYKGYTYERFIHEGELYIRISSEYLKEDDIPRGFKVIKASEYYKILESLKEENMTK